ncbi:DUF948 domain-containing protein [Sporosarcina gallistercoris]|uniref:DUF948 domain-containing protein n=1 Tax=Sporosarcina gallistercoris TaxID=2762245 RepID=A0ABR8PMT4_9BACL|nr:DUF948 domain-containing protein [Sporosarcina gallistercoris]MBD7909478.1 DUF948 domain-containing protein [Sporosarcina gallistercoris]
MTFVHIGVFLLAVSFAIFAIYLCIVLTRISGLLTTVGSTANRMADKADVSIKELELTIVEARTSATDVQLKLDALNSVAETAKNLGDTMYTATDSVHGMVKTYAKQPDLPGTKPFVGLIQLAEFASSLFSTWKKAENITK